MITDPNHDSYMYIYKTSDIMILYIYTYIYNHICAEFTKFHLCYSPRRSRKIHDYFRPIFLRLLHQTSVYLSEKIKQKIEQKMFLHFVFMKCWLLYSPQTDAMLMVFPLLDAMNIVSQGFLQCHTKLL